MPARPGGSVSWGILLFGRQPHGDTVAVRAVSGKPFCRHRPSAFPQPGCSFDIPASSERALTCASKRGYAYIKFYTHEEGEEDRGFLRYPHAPGKVIFAVYKPGTDRGWEQERVGETTMDGFVRMLIEGM